MKFRGNLKTISLKGVFQKIIKELLTGNLKIQSTVSGDVNIFFKNGEIAFYQSKNLADKQWAKILFAKGDLSKEDFKMIQSQGIKELSGIISSQIINEEKAIKNFQQIVEEECYSLFLLSEGDFVFETDSEPPAIFANLKLFKKIKFQTKSVLIEGMRRSEGNTADKDVSSNEIYDMISGKEKAIRPKLNPEELRVFELINGVNSVFEILRDSGAKKQNIAIILKKLIDLQAIKVSSTKDLLSKAIKLDASKDFDSSSKIYQRLVDIEKTVLNHRKKLAEALLKCQKSDQALIQLEFIAKKYTSLKDYNKANEALLKIVETDDNKPNIRELIANNYIELDMQSEAITELMKLMDFYINKGQFDSAQNAYFKIIKLDPDNIEVMGKLAKAYANSGNRIQATNIWSTLSEKYIDRKMFEEAVDILLKITKLDPSNNIARETLESLQGRKKNVKIIRTFVFIAIAIIAISLLAIFIPKTYQQAFPGTPSFDQEVERCKLLALWLKKKKIDEMTIFGMSDTLTTVLKKEGLKVSTSASLNFGVKKGEDPTKAMTEIKAFIINEAIKDISIVNLKKYFEAGGVIYFRGFDNKLSENEQLCQVILEFIKKGQICVVLPKFPEKDVRKLSTTNRVLSENIFVDETNWVEFENWRNKIVKNKELNAKSKK